jgi:hypothetical protein
MAEGASLFAFRRDFWAAVLEFVKVFAELFSKSDCLAFLFVRAVRFHFRHGAQHCGAFGVQKFGDGAG